MVFIGSSILSVPRIQKAAGVAQAVTDEEN